MRQPFADTEVWHANCVALDGSGLLILGRAGGGKTALSLEMLARGAALVADDRVRLVRTRGGVEAHCPGAIEGLIEARGVGILRAASCGPATVMGVVDLDRMEAERLPPRRFFSVLHVRVPLFLNTPHLHFAASLVQFLKCGLYEDP